MGLSTMAKAKNNKVKVVELQRSRGYSFRKSFTSFTCGYKEFKTELR